MQEIEINYTIATGEEPDVELASANCHNSHVLLRNYEMDSVSQADRDELQQTRTDIDRYTQAIAFTKHTINSQSLVDLDSAGKATLKPFAPSPPPPPPPALEDAPPAPPEVLGGELLIQRYEELIVQGEARADELVLKLDECFVKDRADDTVCGLTSNEAPHPWMALNDVKCRGYDTLSAREEDYCGYCKPVAIQTNTLLFTHSVLTCAISCCAQGSPRSTRSRPTASCARSSWPWGRTAWTRAIGWPTARRTPRARSAAASRTSST
jgi:hypothetical protein